MDLSSTRTRWILAGIVVAVVALAVVTVLILVQDDGEDGGDGNGNGGTTSTAEPAPTTTEDGGTTSTTADPSTTAPDVPDAVARQAVWPRPSSEVRFDRPVAAVRSFARYYAHFGDPIIGDFQQGDSRSGEVPVRYRPGGPVTTVLVRQLAGDSWFVIGSATGNILVAEPGPGDALRCPMPTSGDALAFEGTVQVRIDAYQPDGDRVEVGRDFVTGAGSPPPGPFEGEIACDIPSGVEDHGIVRYWTEDISGEIGGPMEIVTFPVRLR